MNEAQHPFASEFSDIRRDVERTMREHLLRYLDRFVVISGIPDSMISREAVGDPSFISKFRVGRELTPRKYDTLIAYFDRMLTEYGERYQQELPTRAADSERKAKELKRKAKEEAIRAAALKQAVNV